ncbi:D-alanyl-D-alanine carboxypeptidase [Paenibacillus antri]|uniref:D-alanyl-D-alanine carboxypeptidase n=1 Tax=Paenibacillus antri TaxID=2582848 RepID=A0A5R9GA97_9BACL|nr:D-alanyl-D-alanine carboxypeptidase family protein [Paenibacillus antri]TLS50004.1 D-alanyl-D-alanine carboxypeptidase [Paenibacillus antri]
MFLRMLLIFAIVSAAVFGNAISVTAAEAPVAPKISSGSAIIMEKETGTILFEKAAKERMYPASITKIVTGIVALEISELEEIVTVSEEARYEEGTRVYLSPGEQKSMKLLLYGLLLNSGNDAATAIAEHIDGSKRNFADRMNEFVKEIGVQQTHFTNPHGLHESQHYTTAIDMALITRYAMANSVFREIVATKTLPWDGEEWDSELVNHNKLLWRYEGATGVKNGYTDQSGNTLVASAERNGNELIVVLLKGDSSEAVYDDAVHLLDYGFELLQISPIEPEVEKEEPAVPATTIEPIVIEKAPIKETSVPNYSNWLLAIVWFTMNLFIVMVAFLRWKKSRRDYRINSERHES